MNTKSIGEISEGVILAKFLQLGWIVLIPFGDNQRYDLVIDRGDGFERVQVKTGRFEKGAVLFPVCSSSNHRENGNRKHYRGQADLFGVYCKHTNDIYLIKVEDTGNSLCSLRIDPPKNNQDKLIKWAKDYKI